MKSLIELLPQLPGARVVGDLAAARVLRVHSDTRSLLPGDLFVALKGERFDAHSFLPQAAGAGAVAALASGGLAAAGLPGVEVPDTRVALGQLAAAWRAQMRLPVIAVTGSNGKTTVTQMLASVLRAAAGELSLATAGNFNNDIGVPLTLLRLLPTHRLAVVELGMNHPGEIAGLATMAQPTVALVNNAQREHQEFMASVEAVARENGQVFGALSGEGVAVFPADDPHTAVWRAMAGPRACLTFSVTDHKADVHGQGQWQGGAWQLQVRTPVGELRSTLHIAGRHNLHNALAAIACACAAGVPLSAVAEGLAAFRPVAGRSHTSTLQLGFHALVLVDDTYNANPDSVRAAVDVLAELPGPRLLVLGDMGEVGTQALAFHNEVLAYAAQRRMDHVLCTGEWMGRALAAQATGALHFASSEDLVREAVRLAPEAASALVKGSRSMRMERVVHALKNAADTAAGDTHVA